MGLKKPIIFVAFLLALVPSGEGAPPIKEEAIRFRIRGYQLQHQGHLEEATEYYRQAIAVDPHYAAPHNDLGVIFEEKGELEGAEGEYLEALKLDPVYVDAYSNLAILYEKMQQREKMIAALQKRVALGRPDDILTQEARAKLESLGIVAEMPQSLPPVPPPRITIAAPAKVTPLPEEISPPQEEAREARPETAHAEEERALEREMNPMEESIFLRNEGLKRQRQGDLAGAIRYYRSAIKKNPRFATAYNDLGIALEEREFLESAASQYRKALSINPDYTQALYNLGFLYIKMERREDAMRSFEEFVAQEKEGKWVKEARAELKRLQSEEKKSEEKKVATAGEGPLISFFEEGKLAYQKGDYLAAEDFFEKVLLLDPENPLGKSYLAKTEKAIQEVKREEEEEHSREIREAEGARRKEEKERRREEETKRREEERKKREAEEAQRKEEERLAREAREKVEAERKRLAEEKEKLAREAKEKVLEEQKRIEEENKQKEIETLYEEAKKLYREGELEGSLSKFQRLVGLVPDHPYAGRYMDRIHEKQKEQEEERKAKEAEEKAREEAAQKAEEERKQRLAVNFAEGKRLLDEGQFENAIDAFQAVLSLDASHKEAKRLLKKAQERLVRVRQKNLIAKAKKKGERVKDADGKMKKMAQLYYEEGLRVFRKGELEKAVYAFEKTLSLNKNHEKARKQLAFVKEKQAGQEATLWRTEQEKSYRKEFTQVEALRLYERAKAAYDIKDYELAKQTLEYLLTLDPTHPFAQGDLEEVEEKMREERQEKGLAQATLKKEAEKALEVPPQKIEEGSFVRAQQGPEEAHKRATSHMQKDILPLEEEEETGAHPSMGKIAIFYQDQAYDLQRRNDIEGAITYYQKAMAIRPSPGAANGLGVLYERKGWYVQAEDAYRQALALDFQYLAAHTNLALLYERLERRSEALRHWKIRAEGGEPGDLWTQKAWNRLEGLEIKKSP